MNILEWLNSFGPVSSKSQAQSPLNQVSYRYLGLYFTATWCSYCHKIADKMPPLLASVNSKGSFLRLLTIRLDEDGGNFGCYDLKYKSLSNDDASDVANWCKVFSIPSILIYDYLGRLVTKNGYAQMSQYKENTIEVWDRRMQLE